MTDTNSISTQLYHLNRLYNNALKILTGYNEALRSDSQNVVLSLENENGSTSEYTIPSNVFLKHEIDRLSDTVNNISGFDDGSTVLASDGSYRQIAITDLKTSIDRLLFSELTVSEYAVSKINDAISSLTNPKLHLDIVLPERLRYLDSVKITKYVITDITNITSGMGYYDFYNVIKNRQFTKSEYILQTEKPETRYFGAFDVLSLTVNSNNTITLKLADIRYNDAKNIVSNSRSLSVNDYIVTADGISKFIVVSVDSILKNVTVKHVTGLSSIQAGLSTILFNDTTLNERHVHVPLSNGDNTYVLFISPVKDNIGNVSAIGTSIFVDQSTLFVKSDDNQTQYTYNEYLDLFVNDIGVKLNAFLDESSIPRSLAVIPSKPVLDKKYFDVKQINSHITTQNNIDEIKKLSSQKSILRAEISSLNNRLIEIRSRISEGNYTTSNDRNNDIKQYNDISDDFNKKSITFNNVVSNITSIASAGNISSADAKYRVIGFWPVQDDLISINTEPQKIVQYEIRYRYLSSDNRQSPSLSVSYNENGVSTTGTKSNWNVEKTVALERLLSSTGKYVWSANAIDSTEQVNMNECFIPIQTGESVELQVRAITECGYPYNPIKSDWSESVIIPFPEELLSINSLNTLVSANNSDQITVEIDKTLRASGISAHLNDTFEEQNKFFAHTAQKIYSGFRTTQQEAISVFDKLMSHDNQFLQIMNILNRRTAELNIDIIDDQSRSFPVSKYSTINLFAGYYTDEIDVSKSTDYGNIIEKTYYIRIANRSEVTAEILSIKPGNLSTSVISNDYENVPLFMLTSNNNKDKQRFGQIFYLRNKSIDTGEDLYVINNESQATSVASEDVDNAANMADKHVLSYDGSNITKVKIKSGAQYNGYGAILDTHPDYVSYSQNISDVTLIESEFDRLSYFANTISVDNKQLDYDSTHDIRFVKNDKYFIGRNTCGANLYVNVNDIKNAQVNGVDSGSSFLLNSGISNAILIPIKFQYRMMDALGNVGGSNDLNINSNFIYKKKLGVDIIINNEILKFDIQVSAKFRSNTVSTQQSDIETINRLIDSGSSSTPKIV